MSLGQGPGRQPGPNESRNLIVFAVIAIAALLLWDTLYTRPMQQRLQAERARVEAQHRAETPAAAEPAAPLERADALAQSAAQRVRIVTTAVDGSILLRGARIDDLSLQRYRETIKPNSPEVTLLQPNGSTHGRRAPSVAATPGMNRQHRACRMGPTFLGAGFVYRAVAVVAILGSGKLPKYQKMFSNHHILIADDHAMFRAGVRSELGAQLDPVGRTSGRLGLLRHVSGAAGRPVADRCRICPRGGPILRRSRPCRLGRCR